MGRKGRIWSNILTLLSLAVPPGCIADTDAVRDDVVISFSGGGFSGGGFSGSGLSGKAYDPDEMALNDITLMIFDKSGEIEENIWIDGGGTECSARLVAGKEYIFCACANFGYRVYADNVSELEGIVFQLAYPDEYREGMPMYAYMETAADDGHISIRLERLMAKISLRIDRRQLSEGVEMNVRAVRIGNCPRKVRVFGRSMAENGDWCFSSGFSRCEAETDPLNMVSASGLSGTVSLYMLENMQGKMPEEIGEDSGKVFGEDDYMAEVCSYVEIEVEYLSEEYYSGGKGLIYRFYLGEDRNSLDIERNCHYHIVVTPEDDGLSEDGWRVDKSDLTYCGPTSFEAFPSEYIVGDIGDKIHIWCEFFPEDAPFDVGINDMEFDRENGIYDYVIDEDGHGAVLTLKKPGTGMVYMEAGPPVNDAALFFIEVNLP